MCSLKAVIFDVDGTLAETERYGHRVAFNQAFIENGLDWHWDPLLYGQLLAVTGGRERIRYYLENFHLQCGFNGDLSSVIDKLHADKTRHYGQLLTAGRITLRSGVKRLIETLSTENIQLAIATTTMPENVRGLITNTLGSDAINWFDCIADGGSVKAKKPAADIYQFCLQQLKLCAQDCLVIEDSALGLKAATDAGLATLITVNDYTVNDNFDQALSVVDKLGEPEQPLKQLAGAVINGHYINVSNLKALHAQAY